MSAVRKKEYLTPLMATGEGHDLSRTVALYARVSTKGRQEVENQRRELRDYCHKRGWMIVGEYVDLDSGTLAEREAFKQLFAHAYQLKFNTVLFWALDRFSREGVHETLNYLKQLEEAGVSFKSYTEPYLDTLGPFRDALIGILASLAKQEVLRRSERVRAGMARAKAQGRPISRRPLPQATQQDIVRLYQRNIPKREIARRLSLDPKTVRNYLKMSEEESSR